MNCFSVQTILSTADWLAYANAWTRRLSTNGNRQGPEFGKLVLVAIVGGLVAWTFEAFNRPFHAKEFIAGLIFAICAVALRTRLLRRKATPSQVGLVLGPVTIELANDGIYHRRMHSNSFTDWAMLQDLTSTPEHIFLWVDRVAGYIIPVRDLPTQFTVSQAVAEIRRLAVAGGAKALANAAAGEETAGQSPVISDHDDRASVTSSLLAVGRLYAFRPLNVRSVVGNEYAIFLLAVLSIGLWALLDWQAQEGPSQFFPPGLTGVSWYLLAAIVVAWVIAKRCIPFVRLRITLWILASVAPLLIAGLWLAENHVSGRWAWLAIVAALGLCITYTARAMRASTGDWQAPAITLGLALAVLIGFASNNIYVSASLWLPEPRHNSLASWEQGERLLYAQSDRIDAAVAHLAGPNSPGPATYMVGFAGVGEQRVFAGEIDLAARIIGDRYGTTSRTVLLVNDERDLEARPLATVSGLRRTLHEIAERMDRDRDVLFLVLSSHGSKEAAISVSNGSLPLKQLTAEELAGTLKASGIRWKVIIISACYSGAFIRPLKDDGTILLTAAAADQTSFGCSNDRDLTYFGEAFFRDALPKAATLREAFDRAASALAAREKAEHITPSNPQAFYGAAIANKLVQLEPATSTAATRLHSAP